jgi:hypothetical protein
MGLWYGWSVNRKLSRTGFEGVGRISNDTQNSNPLRPTTSGRLPHTATIRSLVCSREMRPLAFLDPSAFPGTNPLEAGFRA